VSNAGKHLDPTFEQPIVGAVWRDKYRHGDEASIEDTLRRVVAAVYAKDQDGQAQAEAMACLLDRSVLPAGRIIAGAGTGKRVTLINCFVNPLIQDSMSTHPDLPGLGLMDNLKVGAFSQQMGGGIGMDYSPVRPRGAVVQSTGSVSSGVLPFMDMWNAMCGTIMSSGSRRGAMMGTLSIWHPDILDFVVAKQQPGRLTNFNVSVLVTDDFMPCLERDLDWDLYHFVPRADGAHVDVYERNGRTHYVYRRIRARELWDTIVHSTYVYAEPGAIFIDRVNHWNNLYYCEDIQCTNPCGEQPLPPNGNCNLGHVNLAVMVEKPFTEGCYFDWNKLSRAAQCLTRFLDNVLDVSLFPTYGQAEEAAKKRRTGVGFTGLASALQQLKIPYGSPDAIDFTRRMTQTLCWTAYAMSTRLARERGPFLLFNRDKYLSSPFVQKLPADIRDGIKQHGIRNGVLMSLAPVGTVSIIAGNISSGIEPVFMHEFKRRVLNPDGKTFETFDAYDYGYLLYHRHVNEEVGSINLPDYFVTARDLSVEQHLQMQAAAQEYVDASISKTINCPTEMTFEEFRSVYSRAYELGLKGCTTYRPDPRSGRGEVLSAGGELSADKALAKRLFDEVKPRQEKVPMQEVADGRRYRVKWPGIDYAVYIIITDYVDDEGARRPFELFLSSKSSAHEEWMKALSLLITAIFRRGGDVNFIVDELKQVTSPGGGMFYNKRHLNSLVGAIGAKIEEHFQWLGLLPEEKGNAAPATVEHIGGICPKCNAPTLVHKEGCSTCTNCGYSNCG
jgi:ribonucleoside-diphosphate reductase alpha chain